MYCDILAPCCLRRLLGCSKGTVLDKTYLMSTGWNLVCVDSALKREHNWLSSVMVKIVDKSWAFSVCVISEVSWVLLFSSSKSSGDILVSGDIWLSLLMLVNQLVPSI